MQVPQFRPSLSVLRHVVALCVLLPALAQGKAVLSAGPMSGYATMREAAIWLQTNEAATAKVYFWPTEDPTHRGETATVQTGPEDAFAATLIAGPLEPGTEYEYAVFLNGEPVKLDYTAKFKTPPFYRDRRPPPDFRVALGGGHYVNDPDYDPPNRIPGDGYQVFLAILAKQPDFMIWLGNNLYLREPDWSSRSGVLARYGKNRAQPELQPLLAGVNHVATMSTHDFGPEGADSYAPSAPHAAEGFDVFWANPPLGLPGLEGVTATFTWSDAEFFILDDRTHRDLNPIAPSKRAILGQAQLDWLINSLRRSTATFKIIVMGSPILNPADSPENYYLAQNEREKFLDAIKESKIDGLFFVTGGKNHGELTKMVRANAPDAYELTLGPMTGRPDSDTNELNYFRVPSTSIFQRHFAVMDFYGPENDRQLRITTFDANGTQLWTQNFHAKDMDYK